MTVVEEPNLVLEVVLNRVPSSDKNACQHASLQLRQLVHADTVTPELLLPQLANLFARS
jgi:hypothetical protein